MMSKQAARRSHMPYPHGCVLPSVAPGLRKNMATSWAALREYHLQRSVQQHRGVLQVLFLVFTESMWQRQHHWVLLSSQRLEVERMVWSPSFPATLMVLVIQGEDRGDGLSEVEIDRKL